MYNLYFIVLSISFFCSLISFRLHYPFHLKLFSVFLGITVITEICAVFLLGLFHLKTNYPVYNSFMLVEYVLYAWYFSFIIESKKIKKIVRYFIFLMPEIWMATIFLAFGMKRWDSYMVMFGDCFLIILCVINFYELFASEKLIDLKTSPEFWISVGTFVYSCCELPITGILNFLGENYASLVSQLENVLQILNIIMYSIFTYAFLCPILTNTTKSQ
jgi:hypothetical protein